MDSIHNFLTTDIAVDTLFGLIEDDIQVEMEL